MPSGQGSGGPARAQKIVARVTNRRTWWMGGGGVERGGREREGQRKYRDNSIRRGGMEYEWRRRKE